MRSANTRESQEDGAEEAAHLVQVRAGWRDVCELMPGTSFPTPAVSRDDEE